MLYTAAKVLGTYLTVFAILALLRTLAGRKVWDRLMIFEVVLGGILCYLLEMVISGAIKP
jgi:multisubunit Na+/H+ antiporter MnhF subunit